MNIKHPLSASDLHHEIMKKAKSNKSWDKQKVKQQITSALTVVDTVKNIHWMQILWSFVAKEFLCQWLRDLLECHSWWMTHGD